MPIVNRLDLHHFRNLTTSFLPADGLNVLVGPNGSGKTSVLEGLYLLSRGRSFRTSHHQHLIEQGHNQAIAQANYQTDAQTNEVKALLPRAGKKIFQINQKKTESSLQLMRLLPVFFLDPHNINVVAAEPRQRRGFIDGLLFHMEQQYISCYKEYLRCLQQRNRLLRFESRPLLADWNEALAQRAEVVEARRRPLVTQLIDEVKAALADFRVPRLREIELIYWKGWEGDFPQALERSISRDQANGWTAYGCHRADIRIILGRIPAAQRLSLGQQKMVALAFFCAAHRLLMTRMETRIPFMLDDIVASLDYSSAAKVMDYLDGQLTQAFVTLADEAALGYWTQRGARVFHMEHSRG